jgi:hypothetical protein
MIQLNLDDIEAVLDRANDDADRVSVYEYREALNAVYRTTMRILAEKMALKAHFILIAQACGNEDPDTAHHAVRARVAERDAAVAKAAAYERDWYDAKSEFGTATAKLRERVRVVERERDEARARATFAEKELSDAFGLPPTIGPSGGEAKRVVDRLRAERRQLRRRLVECRPWVGVCPLEPAKINEACLVRDLADDTLEEVKE